jgi:hypothetical protein
MKSRIASISAVLVGWFAFTSQSWASTAPVPEIDGTGVMTGLAVLAGVLALVAERKRQR